MRRRRLIARTNLNLFHVFDKSITHFTVANNDGSEYVSAKADFKL